MNFKRNLLFINTLFSVLVMCCSCSSKDSFEHARYISAPSEDIVYEDFTAYNINNEPVNLGKTSDVMRNYFGKKLMNTTGDQKLLVIPVEFEDYTCDDLGISKEKYIDNVNKAFFGSSKNNSYVSVAEYFNISSYGRLRINGKVCDSFYTYKNDTESKNTRHSVMNKYDDIVSWYKEKYNDINEFAISGLGEEQNIAIYLVYTHPAEIDNEEDFYWAYTFPDIPLSWSSYSFLNTDYGMPDAHTYIHETGHLLGLCDYYPNESRNDPKTIEPTARIDMMDCSIGDESGLSKMMLNWVKPNYITSTTDITLRPFESSGDLILLNRNWNNTIFDEYYLLEFYTPTGLNTYDTYIGNSEAKLPLMPGLKIYHIDSRLGFFEPSRNPIWKGYCTEGYKATPAKGNISFAHTNNTTSNIQSGSETYHNEYNLCELVLNGEEKGISRCAGDEHLFHTGDSIRLSSLHTQTDFGCVVEVKSLNFREINISITF